MIHVKELTPVTGYVRGGCSPIGMKKAFPVYLHESAAQFEQIYISGGRVGTTLRLAPGDLLAACGGKYADLTAEQARE